ncbi:MULTISPECIES: ABC transporter ATP-binding protein [Actinomyces]|uniref:ABC transporter ATP-binding protein n=1 Tax=Actinomyces TaxID=1654 RepID=UPI001FAA12D9|nr:MULTISPECIES: ABC transporter ATP-binding protein [Actinomyces]
MTWRRGPARGEGVAHGGQHGHPVRAGHVGAGAWEPDGAVGQVLVSARGLSVGYGGVAVCAPASLTLRPGQVLALVGVNGAGKSTLVRTCCGLLPPVEGEVRLLGRIPDPRSAAQRAAVAWDLGEDSFFPSLTVAEHLGLVCYGHGVLDADTVVDSLLTDLDLIGQADSLPDRLSSGQRRRLALASVLARPRRLLVLDEPEQRLDHVMRRLLAQRLVQEAQEGRAVLLASHDPALVAAAATQVLLVGAHTCVLSVEEGLSAMKEGL